MRNGFKLPYLHNHSLRERLLILAAAVVLYVLAFTPLALIFGSRAIPLSMVPVALIGCLFGLWGGILASPLFFVVSLLLLIAMGLHDVGVALDRGGWAGFAVLIVTGAGVGWLCDVREHLRRELAERRKAEQALQEERDFAEGLLQAEREQRLLAETLTEVALALTSQVDYQAVLEEILRQAHRIVSYDVAHIALLEDGSLHTVHWRCSEESPVQAEPFQMREDLTDFALDREAIKKRWPIVIPDVRQEPRWNTARRMAWVKSYLAVPLCFGRRVLGVLRLNGAASGRFTIVDGQRLLPVASAAAVAIENARLVEGLEEEVATGLIDVIGERERSATILRSVADGIALVDLAGRIEYVNQAFVNLTAYTADEAVGQPIDFVLAEDDVSAHILRMYRLALARKEVWRGEVVIRRKDGRTYEAEVVVAPVRGVIEQQLIGHVVSHRDISQRKALEYARAHFITNVSHQLRTPVTTIQLYIHMLQTETLSERAAGFFDIIQGETERLIALIEDILVMATLESGGREMDISKLIPISDVVRGAVAAYRVQAEESGLTLQVTSASSSADVLVRGDQRWLIQALGELVGNAVTFTPAGGRVTLDVEIDEDGEQPWVKINVRDTGPGIPLDEQDKVFNRFFRGRIVEAGNVPGTGLGLSIAQVVIQAHGGRVTLESEPERGSIFVVWLPVAQALEAH